ncbi:MAG: helix-turn-helix transcriptional regulator [Eubacteriales bacterium]|nr:helix-turn-helix transcriptional regulator [Eubacteriales bacterium]
MELEIGSVITEKRKVKGITQEQLATVVGVTTSAVSKWETGSTYPDITLLSPLARALDTTVDVLLSYQCELTVDEVKQLAERATDCYETKGFDAGWAFCREQLREYPNSIPLKFYLGALFQPFLLLRPGFDPEHVRQIYRESAAIFEDVLAAGDPSYTYQATLTLVGFYAMLHNTERMEALLQSLPESKVEPDFLYASLYAMRGEKSKAVKTTQQNIQRGLTRMSEALRMLCAFEREAGNRSAARQLAEKNYELTQLLGSCQEIAYPDQIKVALDDGDRNTALTVLESYSEWIHAYPPDRSGNPVFSQLQQPVPAYSRKVLAKALLMDPELKQLENEQRYQAVRSKMDAILLEI